MSEIKVLGLPGTGKTTYGAEYARKEGFNGDEIVAETYRKQLAKDFINKVEIEHLPWCSTTHGVCKRLLGIQRENIVTDKNRADFCEADMKIPHSSIRGDTLNEGVGNAPLGNVLFDMRKWLIENMRSARHWLDVPGVGDRNDLSEGLIRQFNISWEDYMNEKNIVDFDEMLRRTYKRGLAVDAKYYFSDEFQDKTPLQNELYMLWRKNAENVIVAGDPYQTIYTYQGASPQFFKDAAGELNVLGDSWRLSQKHWKYGKKILTDVGYSDVPELQARGEGSVKNVAAGEVYGLLNKLRSEEVFILTRAKFMTRPLAGMLNELGIPFTSPVPGVVGWTPTQVAVFNALNKLRSYQWKDNPITHWHMCSGDALTSEELKALASFFRAEVFLVPKVQIQKLEDVVLKANLVMQKVSGKFIDSIRVGKIPIDSWLASRAQSMVKIANAFDQHAKVVTDNPVLSSVPRVYLGTIHSAKGREADNVLLFDNITGRIQREASQVEEARVFFVGATRTRKRLFVVRNYFNMEVYPLPW